MCSGHDHERPSASAAVRNWRDSDKPFLVKCWLVVRNNLKKLFTLRDCCGNYGEPGC